MAFPADPLDAVVELAIGADIHAAPGTWSWTDVTVREAPKVTINRGRRNRIGNFPPTRVQATADNTDGNLCRHNPFSQYYGLLKKNTPMRVRVNNGSGYVTRAAVYVPGFPPSWDPSEQDQTVTLAGVGITDRLGRSKPLRSALYRTITGVASGSLTPTAYWTMEDGSSSTTFASETAGRPAAIPELTNIGLGGNTTPPRVAGSSDIPGSAPCALLLNDNWIRFEGSSFTDTGRWTIAQAIYLTQEDSTSQFGVTFVAYTATHNFNVQIFPGSGMNLFRISSINLSTGSAVFTVDDTITFAEVVERPMYLVFQSNSSAGGTFAARLIDTDGNVIGSVSSTGTGNHAALSGRFNAQVGRQTFGTGTMALAHVDVYTDASYDITTDAQDGARAAGGWAGELAHERAERLCDEERVPFSSSASVSQAMGPQGRSRLLDLLRECANADQGLLFENMDFGLTFVSAAERYNLDPAITLDYSASEILPPWDPDDDDQDYYNSVTATRPSGSSATAADDDEIDEVGLFADQITPNVQADDQLDDVAGWRLNLGLNDELTWPAVRPNVIMGGSLLDDWLATDLGQQLHVTGHPSPLAPQTIRQVIEGYTEVLGSYTYDVTANLSPASPWDVAVYGVDPGGVVSRYGAADTTLAAAVNSSATTWTVDPATETWATTLAHPTAFPFDIDAGGLTYSCTGISDSILDTFARTTSNGWGSTLTGQAWSESGAAYSTNGSRGLIAVNAGVDVHTRQLVDTLSTNHRIRAQIFPPATATGGSYLATVIVRAADLSNHYAMWVHFETTGAMNVSLVETIGGSAAFIGTSGISTGSTYNSASTVEVDVWVVGSQIYAKAWVGTEPGGWHLQATDTSLTAGTKTGLGNFRASGNSNGAISVGYDNVALVRPYLFNVTRLASDKAQSAGTAITVTDTGRYGL